MASILKVDDLRGNTAAGDITITSEGGSATMQLQQGLVKSWCHIDGDGTPAISGSGSFNVASLTDIAVSQVASNFTNNMADDDFSAMGMPREQGFVVRCQELDTTSLRSTSRMVTVVHNAGEAQADCDGRNHTVHGDLA